MPTELEGKTFGVVGLLLIATLPFQTVAEAVYWLRFGNWFGASMASLLGEQTIAEYAPSSWAGLTYLMRLAAGVWISWPLAILGLGLLKLSEVKGR
jgi:hypothetical protein